MENDVDKYYKSQRRNYENSDMNTRLICRLVQSCGIDDIMLYFKFSYF